VNSPSDAANTWAEAQKQKKPILLHVRREGQFLFVAVPA
jgi:serine protease Do